MPDEKSDMRVGTDMHTNGKQGKRETVEKKHRELVKTVASEITNQNQNNQGNNLEKSVR